VQFFFQLIVQKLGLLRKVQFIDPTCIAFVVIDVLRCLYYFNITSWNVVFWCTALTGATSGAGTAYTSGAPEFSPVFSGVRVTRSLVLCVCFGHCVVCSSSIYGFRLPIWYLQTLLWNCTCSFLNPRQDISWTGLPVYIYTSNKADV
jgi:hypothetical protein